MRKNSLKFAGNWRFSSGNDADVFIDEKSLSKPGVHPEGIKVEWETFPPSEEDQRELMTSVMCLMRSYQHRATRDHQQQDCDFCGLPVVENSRIFAPLTGHCEIRFGQTKYFTHHTSPWLACQECARIISGPFADSRLAHRAADVNPQYGEDSFGYFRRWFRGLLPTLAQEGVEYGK